MPASQIAIAGADVTCIEAFVWRAMHILAQPLEDKARIRLAASLPHMDEDFLPVWMIGIEFILIIII